ncbi:right-handed parallel beta-helix repeat-containing protein [Luteimonas mephitis]|uniref:right-handed parallel beta-helix repeat-containing protein n=1 Tax=Luteimonas mephitis TaxID=83615 RepID=UPI00041BD151|nr:right-handed parallel beta-helix repeat-containing protein [Luteimonas mephitis]
MNPVTTCLRIGCLLAISAPLAAPAATYTVGPSGRQYTQLSQLFNSRDLAPGDIVLVDGNATYSGDIVMRADDSGSPGRPVVVRWNRASGSSRPVLQGGTHTIKFERANHVVFEGFEVRGGSRTCVFSEADDITVRDSVIHDCPSHGILGADNNSGSFTLEYSELYNSGAGTTRHTIYMQSDEVAFPNAEFVMRYNYVHDGTGGVLVRVRHQRSQIYYNWIENSVYGELELIGPDCETQTAGWTADLKREDADVVGNVIIHRNNWRNAIRAGGDLNGRSQGRVRLVNNTIVFDRAGAANAVMVQLGLQSLEMHNNVVYQTAAGSTPAIVRENPASEVGTPYCGPMDRNPWTTGRKVAGTSNWVQSGAMLVPYEWTGTVSGASPGFANAAQNQLRPAPGSPLIDSGTNSPPSPSGFPYPSPLLIPDFEPPLRAKMAIGGEVRRTITGGRIDIGALEGKSSANAPIPLNGAQPLKPPPSRPATPGGEPAASAADDGGTDDGSEDDAHAPPVIEQPKQQPVHWWQRVWRWIERLLRLG